jgi:hypothetical protein
MAIGRVHEVDVAEGAVLHEGDTKESTSARTVRWRRVEGGRLAPPGVGADDAKT